MNAMALTRQAELLCRRVRLTTGPAAAAESRNQLRAAICAWNVPVDPDVAVLLASELVTNAIRHEMGGTITLAVTCSGDQLRVEVHDTSCFVPVPVDAAPDAETGRGLMLVESLSAEWGCYPTPTGKAVYFTLGFQPEPEGGAGAADAGGAGVRAGMASRQPAVAARSRGTRLRFARRSSRRDAAQG
jgi:anti-sigma regulatory factor (Ser/Thr protein kinase)